MVETKLNVNNNHHKLLIALLTNFATDYGYHPREIIDLMRDTEKQLYFALLEMHEETNK